MGRNTPSLRVVVRDYVDRFRKTASVLSPDERSLVEKFLEDIETTMSACMHAGVVDPLEVFLVHLVRKLRELCKQC